MLHNLTVAVNFVALMMALWLGLYLVTRSPHRPETWLAALALWSMSGFFLNQLLALNPPPTPPEETRKWLHYLILFWPRYVFEMGWQGWLQGWLPSYSVVFWYHATLYMLPGRFQRKRLLVALAGYAIALAGILIKTRASSTWINLAGSPLYSSSLPTPLFPLFAIGFVAFAGLSVFNLAQTMRSSPATMSPHQFHLFIYATLLGGATGLVGIASNLLKVATPQVLIALLLSAVVLLSGIGVARYSALLDRRSLQRDLIYSATEVGAILLVYMFFLKLFTELYPLPAISFVFTGCLAVISHLLIDVSRLRLDRMFFQHKRKQLKLRLRHLFSLIEEHESSYVLEVALETISNAIDANWVILLRFNPQGLIAAAAWNWTGPPIEQAIPSLTISDLCAKDLMVLNPPSFPPPLELATLVMPLSQQEQIGVLLIGPSRSQAGYSEIELETLQDASDLLSNLLRDLQLGKKQLERSEAKALFDAGKQIYLMEEISPRLVELGLRNLHDYAYLGDSPLAKLRLVERCLESAERGLATHIERGQAVSSVLREAVAQLKPALDEPGGTPPRTWHPYIILRDAYLDDEPNRQIMSRLYISEGTFNRTRRSAICSVARLLTEMEANLYA